MRARRIPFITLILFQVSRIVFADVEFQRSLGRLNSNQQRLDTLLKGVGFEDPRAPERQAERSHSPLFQVHGDLLQVHIPAGKLYFGKLINRLVVGADGSPTLVELDEGQGFVGGLRLMGTARQAGTPGRISVEVTRLLLRSGRAITVQAVALDTQGGFGLSAQVLSGKALAVAGAMASSFIAGALTSQQTQSTNAFGFSQTQPTGRNAILQGAAQTAADQSKRLIEESTAEKPVMVVEALTPVTILIQEEVKL